MKRSSGILLPIASLPSPYGIGTLGREAYAFVDFLAGAGQSWWQILPVGPTSYGDSPYQSFSTFAGNPYFVDPDYLKEDGLLTDAELDADWGDDPGSVDYGKIYEHRFEMLKKAAERGIPRDREALARFREQNSRWIEDYALFMALKRHFGMRAWHQWPEDIRMRRPEALAHWREELRGEIDLFVYIQFLFFGQWERLRAYAHKKGVGIIGDLPIYVALDSADVWAEPQFFQLDEDNMPTKVAGVPPDAFTEDGQLWGNPLYDWDAMKRDGYGWWIRRVDGAGKLYDALRIDHFRGFASYWSVPAEDATAKNGVWVPGPGMDLVRVLINWFPQIQFIAEDLGLQTPDVVQLLKDSGLPGMKVLEFAFDGGEPNEYQPHNYGHNCICYTGTHDNEPLAAWWEELPAEDRLFVRSYLGLNAEEGPLWGVIRGGMSSVADLFVAQLQDYLGLGTAARINRPGEPAGNWSWRLRKGMLNEELQQKILDMTCMYGRCERPAEPAPDQQEAEG